jgi:hypothetical protein
MGFFLFVVPLPGLFVMAWYEGTLVHVRCFCYSDDDLMRS